MTASVRRWIVAAVCLGAWGAPGVVSAQVAVSRMTSIGLAPKLDDFERAAADYFGVSDRDVAALRARQMSDDDLPVALFIAQQADLKVDTVADLRARHYSWWEISARYRLDAEAFYVPASGATGPAYGRAFGYYTSRPRSQWSTIVLGDADIVNLVQLRFLSRFYRVSPSLVIDLREHTGDFLTVQREIEKLRAGESGPAPAAATPTGRGRGGEPR